MPKTKKRDLRAHWAEVAKKKLQGKRVVAVRYLNDEEMAHLGWDESVLVLEFDDGTLLFSSRDDEGNGGGAMFGQDSKNEFLNFPVIRGSLL